MAHQVQQVTSREAGESARQLGRLPYSRSSFERVAHSVGALYVPAHGDIEDALIEQYEVPAEARSVSVSLDRVSVAMEEPLQTSVGRPKKDAPKRNSPWRATSAWPTAARKRGLPVGSGNRFTGRSTNRFSSSARAPTLLSCF